MKKAILKICIASIVSGAANGSIAAIRLIRSCCNLESREFAGLDWGFHGALKVIKYSISGYLFYFCENIVELLRYIGGGSIGSIFLLTLVLLVIFLFLTEAGFKRFFAGLNVTLDNFAERGFSKIGEYHIPEKPVEDQKRDEQMIELVEDKARSNQ